MHKRIKTHDLTIDEKEKAKLAAELIIANQEKAKREAELVIANEEKAKRAAELVIANQEKGKRATELVISNANKAKRAAELVIANAYKAKCAAVLVIANIEKENRADELITAEREIIFQNEEKLKLSSELVIADVNRTKREAELVIANIEKTKQIAKLIITEAELSSLKEGKSKNDAKLVIADTEKAKLAAELVIANIEKAKRAAELVIANIEKAKRDAELVIINKELVYQKNEEAKHTVELVMLKVSKAKRAAELVIANIEKAKRAAEFVVVSKELVLSQEKAKLIKELTTLNEELNNEIEKRKQSDEALKESNEKYSEAFKSSPYSITITSLAEGRFIEVNDAFTKIFGFTSEEAITSSSIKLDIWVNIEERNSVVSTLRDGRIVSGKEFLFKKKNGVIMTGSFSARIININKEPFIISSFEDITERKQAEKKRLESEERLKFYMDNSPMAVVEWNSDFTITRWTGEANKMFGWKAEEVVGKKLMILNITHEQDIPIIQKTGEEIKSGLLTQLFSCNHNHRKDGSIITCEWYNVILKDENGKIQSVLSKILDVTERKNAEYELKKKMDEIESINNELNKTNVELTLAKEKAEESDRLKSAFLSNMSHEIRTPMNGILGFAELLTEPQLTIEEQQDFIQTIQISGARMLNTINSIIDVSKIESGLIGVDIKETNLNEKMEFTYKFFKPEAENKGLKLILKSSLPDKEAIIKTDNEKVYGILTNLIRNAIKFTYEGSIEFGCERKGKYLEFFVKDNGIGIPQKQQQLIFERFRQGNESHNRNYEGSGLGLSISKSYVEMLSGRIWVESEEGLGSTFYFTIPYIAVSEEITSIENFDSEEHKEVQLNNLKILIVEDDEISYSLLLRTMQKIGKEILHAMTGIEAVEACRNNPDLDLILMDIRMPQMSGLEATKRIRQFNKDVIIIAQTAYAFTRDCEKALEAGCNEYIIKPVNMTLLFELVKKHIMVRK